MVSAAPSRAEPLLSIERLRFRWPRSPVDTLAIAQFAVARGETLFLRGPSGSGKSTLLALVAGVLVADDGRVALDRVDWRTLAPARRDARRADLLGVVFQQFNLLPYLSALDNVLLPCRFSAARRERAGDPLRAAAALLDRMGLAGALMRRPAAELSVGQQQRVAAARALIGTPALVVADEPTSALDEDWRDQFLALLLGAVREAGSALLFVSHDARLAGRFSRQVDLPAINTAPVEGMAA